MSKISLAKLVAGSVPEAERMLSACNKLGFFLLDLSDNSIGREMIREVDDVFDLARKTMRLSLDEKNKYLRTMPRDSEG